MKILKNISLGYILLFFLFNVWISLAFDWRSLSFVRTTLYIIFAIAIFILSIQAIINLVKKITRFDFLDFFIIAFVCWQTILTFFVSKTPNMLPEAILYNTGLGCLLFLIIRKAFVNNTLNLTRLFLTMGWAQAILCLLEALILPPLYWMQLGILAPSDQFGFGIQYVGNIPQVMGFLISPNYAAAFILIIICLSLTLYSKKTNPKSSIFILISLCTIALSWTFCRSATLAFFIVLLIWSFWKKPYKNKFKTSIFLLLLFFCTFFGRAFFYNAPLADLLLHGQSTNLHQQALENAISNNSSMNIFTGFGPGFSGFASFDFGQNRMPETFFLQLWQETGLIGLFIWATINILILIKLFKMRENKFSKGLFLAQIALNLMSVFIPIWSVPAISIFIFSLSAFFISQKQKVLS